MKDEEKESLNSQVPWAQFPSEINIHKSVLVFEGGLN